ncbi:hypothetical protein HYR99_23775 [Candidatus Poribacteria bacterium]|nr:hypothetical protein [Candidatus Poribacteria bacterium]
MLKLFGIDSVFEGFNQADIMPYYAGICKCLIRKWRDSSPDLKIGAFSHFIVNYNPGLQVIMNDGTLGLLWNGKAGWKRGKKEENEEGNEAIDFLPFFQRQSV